jgi:hypothetical protein
MVELNVCEIEEVNGGFAVALALGAGLAVGMLLAYVTR